MGGTRVRSEKEQGSRMVEDVGAREDAAGIEGVNVRDRGRQDPPWR